MDFKWHHYRTIELYLYPSESVYHCKCCGENRQPVMEHGSEKCRRFRTGYVGRFLQCKHIIPATQRPVVLPLFDTEKAA